MKISSYDEYINKPKNVEKLIEKKNEIYKNVKNNICSYNFDDESIKNIVKANLQVIYAYKYLLFELEKIYNCELKNKKRFPFSVWGGKRKTLRNKKTRHKRKTSKIQKKLKTIRCYKF
jgi:hypothetical protein